jgi:hypothetical protein
VPRNGETVMTSLISASSSTKQRQERVTCISAPSVSVQMANILQQVQKIV